MATLRQRKAVDKLVETGGNVTKAMQAAGYPPATYNNPKVLTESKGFKELMKEYGLTEGLIAKSLVEDIKKKKQNRIGELRLGSEILGMKAIEGSGDKTLVLVVTGETAKRYGIKPNSITEDSSIGPTQV